MSARALRRIVSTCVAGTIALTAGAGAPELVSSHDRRALERLQSPPLGLPPVPVPDDNPPTASKIALGRKLFFDRRLSFNHTMSCGMCHIPEQGFTNQELATPIGVEGQSLRRNAPTILNAAYASRLFHDGRESSLENQAIAPLLAGDEMANPSIGYLVEKIADLADYDGLFERAFGAGPSLERIGQAIACWERTLLSAASPFDRWRYGGQQDALTPRQVEGFRLFTGKAGCVSCHSIDEQSALFTDGGFHDTGIGHRGEVVGAAGAPVPVELAPGLVVPMDRRAVESVGLGRRPDAGRFEITLDPADRWRFRTPSLRNVALTAPYMHDGSIGTLEEVLAYYDAGGSPHPGLDARIRPLHLAPEETEALLSFLGALTGDDLPALVDDARSVNVGN